MRALLLALLTLPGCYCSHVLTPVDASRPPADTGAPDAPLLADGAADAGSDAGLDAFDGGTDAALPDAGSCTASLLAVEYSSPLHCGDLLLGDPDRQVMVLAMRNRTGRAMRVVQWRFGVVHNPADCALTTIRYVRLRDPLSAASYGESPIMSGPGDTGNFEAFIRPTNLIIPPGESSVSVRVGLATYVDGGCPGHTTVFTEYSGDPFMDVEVVWDDDGTAVPMDETCFSPYILFGGGWVYRANLSLWTRADDTRTVLAAGEQQIGRFFVMNVDNAGLYTATVELMRLSFRGVFGGDVRPRTLRVYKDLVDPANLLASMTFADGRPVETSWRNEEFADTDISPGTVREFLVTIDADGLLPSSTIAVDLEGMGWSDGSVSTNRLGCGFPIRGSTAIFATAP